MNNRGGVFHNSHSGLQERDELRVADTHGIAQWTSNRLLADSTGLGWRDAYTSLAVESSWAATLPALPHYSVAYFVRGSARIDRRVDGARPERAHLRPRQFGMIPADRASSWELVGDPEIQLVYVRRDTVDELAISEFGVDPSEVHVEPKLGFDDALLEQLVAALLDTALRERSLPTSGIWADHLIRLIALELLRNHSNLSCSHTSTGDASVRLIESVREYVDANLAGDLSLARIGEAVGAPAHRLATQFRRHTGVTLHQFVIQSRIERARRLLASTDDPIALIAIECGFASQSHLTTAFGHHVGITPGTYRSA